MGGRRGTLAAAAPGRAGHASEHRARRVDRTPPATRWGPNFRTEPWQITGPVPVVKTQPATRTRRDRRAIARSRT